jgi:preprotein translocase subunit SecA
MNRQRDVIYTMRDAVLRDPDLRPIYDEMARGLGDALAAKATAVSKFPAEWDWDGLRAELGTVLLADLQVGPEERERVQPDDLRQMLTDIAGRRYDERREELGEELFRDLCRYVFLRTIDAKWRDHLYALDLVREGISLRAYGQKDPLVEYKQESFRMFDEMLADLYRESLAVVFRAQVQTADMRRRPVARPPVRAYKPEAAAGEKAEPQAAPQVVRSAAKVGRNDPCPCGSGKKYKRCCGANKTE